MKAKVDEGGLRHEAVPLWPEVAPFAKGSDLIDQPILTIHRPSPEMNVGAACIVAPGGGYRILASDHEGLQVARWLNRRGITAFVLRYRVAPKYHSSISLLDGLRAVRWVRFHSKDFEIDSNNNRSDSKILFSDGGHHAIYASP